VSGLVFTPRERIKMRGYCTGPVDGAPAPGSVTLALTARCPTCGRYVRITVRGKYAHHKPAAVDAVTFGRLARRKRRKAGP